MVGTQAPEYLEAVPSGLITVTCHTELIFLDSIGLYADGDLHNN